MAAAYAEFPLTVRTEAPLASALKTLARKDGTSVSELVRRELRAVVAREGIRLSAANDAGHEPGGRQ